MQSQEPKKVERLEIRPNEYTKRRIQYAAALTGRTVSEFTLQAALEKAEKVSESVESWELNEVQSAFVLELPAKAKPNPKLISFMQKWRAIRERDELEGAVTEVEVEGEPPANLTTAP